MTSWKSVPVCRWRDDYPEYTPEMVFPQGNWYFSIQHQIHWRLTNSEVGNMSDLCCHEKSGYRSIRTW